MTERSMPWMICKLEAPDFGVVVSPGLFMEEVVGETMVVASAVISGATDLVVAFVDCVGNPNPVVVASDAGGTNVAGPACLVASAGNGNCVVELFETSVWNAFGVLFVAVVLVGNPNDVVFVVSALGPFGNPNVDVVVTSFGNINGVVLLPLASVGNASDGVAVVLVSFVFVCARLVV
jgi:hypothetical protein